MTDYIYAITFSNNLVQGNLESALEPGGGFYTTDTIKYVVNTDGLVGGLYANYTVATVRLHFTSLLIREPSNPFTDSGPDITWSSASSPKFFLKRDIPDDEWEYQIYVDLAAPGKKPASFEIDPNMKIVRPN